MAQRIMIADDSPEIREVVNVLLSNEGYEIVEAENGNEALACIDGIDLFILDIMMPEMDGYRACRAIREKSNAPILFLTAKTLDGDKALGFSCGGDDYLVKPFSYNELISRVKALLRRYCVYKGKEGTHDSKIVEKYNLMVNLENNQVHVDGERVALTEIEYRILMLLLCEPKRVFSNQELYEIIWESPYLYTANNTIMVHMRNLRKKLHVDPQNPMYIKTVWGKGYRFE
ncbi:response regulator transcription factor [Amedibacillus sp. YH-ame10]